jgi:hypothetical protein
VIDDDQQADPAIVTAALPHRGGQRGRPVTQPDHLPQARPDDQHDRGGVRQQFVVRAVRAQPAAVRDHVGPGQRGQRRADRVP